MQPLGEKKALLVAITAAATALAGALGLATALRPPPSSASLAANPLPGDATQGRHLYLLNCAHCHGEDAHGDEGPDLYNLHRSDGRIRQVILAGIKGEMPSFGKKLHDPEVRALTVYLRTLH